MPAPGRPVTALLSWAHQPNPGLDPAAWRNQVLDLAIGLRRAGINVDLDLYHLHAPTVDWSRYGPQQVQDCEFVVVAVNAAWRERFEGRGAPTAGAGAAAEADELLGLFGQDRTEFIRKVKLVLLPGADERDVPPRLSGVPRFPIAEPTGTHLADLLRTLTNQPEYIPPPLGTVPVLPPRTLDEIEHAVTLAAETSLTAGGRVSAPPPAAALGHHLELVGGGPAPGAAPVGGHLELSGTAGQREEVETGIALLRSAQTAAGTDPDDDVLRLERLLAAAERRLTELKLTELKPKPPALAPLVERLAGLLEQVAPQLERSNSCWLLVAAVPALPHGDGVTPPGESARDRRQRELREWVEQSAPIPGLDVTTAAIRRPGRVAFTGERSLAGPRAGRSSEWRIEVADDGSTVLAANVAGAPRVVDGVGRLGWPNQPGQTLLDGQVFLPVRRDQLETWLLTGLELAANHLRCLGRGAGQVHLLARLEPASLVTIPQTHDPEQLGLRIVDEKRDQDGNAIGEYPPSGSTDLPLTTATPSTSVLATAEAELADPLALVRIARRFAVELLEHFGVEDTVVLRPDGTLDALNAGRAEWMAIYQHARQLGLPVDPHSPADRQRRYDELLAEARGWLNP